MKITKITIANNKRFSLNNIKLLTYTPERQVQLIAGINGAGKSSLLNELSPFPSDKSDYENGYKIIEITHNNNNYVLTTNNKHSFVINGNELNTAGNKRIQLSLIKEHFKLTPSIYKLVSGNKLFTNMGISARKEWIFEITNLDIDYPLSVFNKLKIRHNELKGAISILTSKGNKKVEIKDLDVLVTSSKQLTSKIEELFNSIEPYSKSKYTIHEITELINKNKLDIKRLTKQLSDVDVVKRDSCLSNISRLKYEIDTTNKSIRDLNRLGEIEKQLENKKVLEQKLLKLTSDPKVILMEGNKILNIVSSIDLDIVDKFIGVDINELKKKYNDVSSEIMIIENNITTKQTFKSVIKTITTSKTDLVCTNCDTKFKHDNLLSNINTLETEINGLSSKLRVLKDTLRTLEDTYKHIDVLESYKVRLSYKTNVPELSIYLVDIFDLSSIASSLTMFLIKVNEHIETKTSIDKINHNIKFMETFNPEYSMDNLYDKLSILIKNKDTYEATLRSIDRNITNNSKIQKMTSIGDEYNKIRDSIISNMKIENHNIKVNASIKEHKELLNKINEEIINSKTHLRVKLERERELTEYKERLSAVKQSMDELSPTTGLIANLLKTDIQNILNQVNGIINEIWDYNITVLPMKIDGDNLTYKFPVSINGEDNASDISLLSTSQREIVDLSFRIVTMSRLNLLDYPFMLDEFARTFDNIHVNNAYDVVNTLKKMFSQIFIVSHFDSTYTKLKGDADVSLLTKDYLTVLKDRDRIELEYN